MSKKNKKKHHKKHDEQFFTFRDLLDFGTFILALLTFIYMICR